MCLHFQNIKIGNIGSITTGLVVKRKEAELVLNTVKSFETGIPACILVFKQNRNKQDVLFIDASGDDYYEKGKNQNKLR